MKVLYLLMAFFVLLASAKPCCTDNDCLKSTSLKISFTKKAPLKKQCEGCSPFFTCGTCAGFVLAKPMSINLPAAADAIVLHATAYQIPFIKSIASAIWQPPKLS